MPVTLDYKRFLIQGDIQVDCSGITVFDTGNGGCSALSSESVVQDTILQSGWENLFVGVAFVGMLVVSFFRLDEVIASPKRSRVRRRPVSGSDKNGHLLLSDPDGRPWGATRKAV
jgi:hypothetical protein